MNLRRFLSRATVAAAVAAAALGQSAFGWSDAGHKIAASIAWRRLTPQRQTALADLLRKHPRFQRDFQDEMPDDVADADQETQNEWIFQQAAVWPDIARGLPPAEKAEFHRGSWHYINKPFFPTDGDRQALEGSVDPNLGADPPGDEAGLRGMNALQAIRHNAAVFKDAAATDEQRALALSWLLHLIPDVHQPLHSTALYADVDGLRDGDEGGNGIRTTQRGNLHSLWDRFPGGRVQLKTARDRAVVLMNDPPLKQLGEAAAGETDAAAWIDESHGLATQAAYGAEVLAFVNTLRAGDGDADERLTLSEAYLSENGKVARTRLVAAGYRLGEVLK